MNSNQDESPGLLSQFIVFSLLSEAIGQFWSQLITFIIGAFIIFVFSCMFFNDYYSLKATLIYSAIVTSIWLSLPLISLMFSRSETPGHTLTNKQKTIIAKYDKQIEALTNQLASTTDQDQRDKLNREISRIYKKISDVSNS